MENYLKKIEDLGAFERKKWMKYEGEKIIIKN